MMVWKGGGDTDYEITEPKIGIKMVRVRTERRERR